MQIRTTPGELKRLRRSLGRFQLTFHIPLDRPSDFVERLLAFEPSPTSAALTVEALVFAPKHLHRLLATHQLPATLGREMTIQAADAGEASALLRAALSDWLDFYFVPDPKRFVLYADHDEYTTLFASRRGPLSQLATGLRDAGFSEVAYVREL